jgi:8-oxo-dGTP diphosphatase
MDPADKSAHQPLGVAAKAIVRRADGAVLLIRRSLESKSDPGAWDLPGGKMDYGERLVDALVREVREETSLAVTDSRPFNITHFQKEPFWVTSVTFECRARDGEVRLSREHMDHAWVALQDLDGRPYARGIREQLQAYVEFAASQPHDQA